MRMRPLKNVIVLLSGNRQQKGDISFKLSVSSLRRIYMIFISGFFTRNLTIDNDKFSK